MDKYIYTPNLDGLTLMETLKKEGWKYNADSIDSRLRLNEMVGGAIRIDTIQKVLRVEYDVLATKGKKPKTLLVIQHASKTIIRRRITSMTRNISPIWI